MITSEELKELRDICTRALPGDFDRKDMLWLLDEVERLRTIERLAFTAAENYCNMGLGPTSHYTADALYELEDLRTAKQPA